MKKERKEQDWPNILAHYNQTNAWMESLILDPEGLRYLTQKTPLKVRQEHEARIERTRSFLHHLGNPQEHYRAIHVTGTSGKGSVATMTANLLGEVNPSVGLHVSPYVQVPNEKLIVDGRMLTPTEYIEQVDAFRSFYDAYQAKPEDRPKYAEIWTCLTHLVFANKKVDWGVIEAGMGGRFDASNIINSSVSVITNVDFDHVPELGPSLTDIAWHKAGIIKPGRPVVTGVTQPELLNIVEQEAIANSSRVYIIGRDFGARGVKVLDEGTVASLFTPFGEYREVAIGLKGNFQAENAAVALIAAQLVLDSEGKHLHQDQIRHALKSVNMPGRFETMQQIPLTVIDGAHNPAKIASLATLLRESFADRKITLIIGMLKNKDVQQSLSALVPNVHKIIATEPHVIGKPSMNAEEMAEIVKNVNSKIEVMTYPDVNEAIEAGLLLNKNNKKGMIVITGSIYMLGEAREYWYPREQLLYKLEYSQ